MKYNYTKDEISRKNETTEILKQKKHEDKVPESKATTEAVYMNEVVMAAPAKIKIDTRISEKRIKMLELKTPTVNIYSQPLLPLPKYFGFKLEEVLNLEQRVTNANFPTISTFTENFEDDIDWSQGNR